METTSKAGTGAIDLSRETWNQAVEVADGVWIVAAHHRPGYSKFQPEINNRCVILRLVEDGQPVLLVLNPIPLDALPEVKRIEKETGLPVRHLVSPGGGHHGTLDEWHAQFPGAKVLLPPGRIPRTKHGQELMKLPRVELLDASDPFPQFRGQLEAVIFDGLLGFRDVQNVREGAKDSPFATIKFMLTEMPPRDPIDELWVHHVATGTVIGGENLGWIQTGESLKAFPFMIRMMLQADAVYVMGGARRVADKAKVAAHWKRILEWPAKTVMTYHDPPTVAFQGDGRAAIEAAAKKVKQL